MDSTQDSTEDTPIPALAGPQQAALDYTRLMQISTAIRFLQFYHNHGGAMEDKMRRAAFVLYLRQSEATFNGRETLHSENPEEYVLSSEGDDHHYHAGLEEQIFLKEIWVQLRKSWMDSVSVQEVTRQAYVIFIEFCKAHEQFARRHYLTGVANDWDNCSNEEKDAFLSKYFSLDEDAFAEWVFDLENREVEYPAMRDTEEYVSAADEWYLANQEVTNSVDEIDFLDRRIMYYEFGGLGSEPRHWAEFWACRLNSFHSNCEEFLHNHVAERALEPQLADDPAFKLVPLTKEEFDALEDDDCPICYEPYNFPDTAGSDDNNVNPVKIHCGHVFCKDCITDHFRSAETSLNGDARCPKCRGEQRTQTEPGTALADSFHYEVRLRPLTGPSVRLFTTEGSQAHAEDLLSAIDQHFARLPADVIQNEMSEFEGTLGNLNETLKDIANYVFGTTEEAHSRIE